MKILLVSTTIILIIIIALFFALRKMQEKLIFFPEQLSPGHQFVFKEIFEEINFQTEENIFINSLLFHSDSAKGLILYFHGNAGALDTWGEVAKDFLPFNYDILLIDFRGYGKSSGEISEESQLYADAEFIYNEMKKKYGEEKIIIYGRSLGSGIASRLAAVNRPKSLILETPFYSLTDIAKTLYPILPTSLVLKYKFENHTWLKQTGCPVYLIHGTKDEIVPYNSSSRLQAISGKIRLFTIEGGAHNNLSDFSDFHSALKIILL